MESNAQGAGMRCRALIGHRDAAKYDILREYTGMILTVLYEYCTAVYISLWQVRPSRKNCMWSQ